MQKQPPDPDLSRLRIAREPEKSPASRPKTRTIARDGFFFVAGVIASLLVTSLFQESGEKTVPTPRIAATSQLSPVVPPSVSETLSGTGYVVAQRQAAVSSKATGRLKELLVREGDTVKAGQVIGVLENDDLIAQVREQEANIQLSEARLKSAQAELVEAGQRKERVVQAAKTGAVSAAERDEALARHSRLAADVAAQEAAIRLARAQLNRAQVELGYTEIVAPFDGTVLTKNADVGEIVAPFGSSTNARAAVVTIADMSSLEVEADISESNIAKVRVGQEAEITLDSYPEKIYRGVVSKVVPTVNRAKGTVLTKIRFMDRDERVLPEMSARVTLKVEGE